MRLTFRSQDQDQLTALWVSWLSRLVVERGDQAGDPEDAEYFILVGSRPSDMGDEFSEDLPGLSVTIEEEEYAIVEIYLGDQIDDVSEVLMQARKIVIGDVGIGSGQVAEYEAALASDPPVGLRDSFLTLRGELDRSLGVPNPPRPRRGQIVSDEHAHELVRVFEPISGHLMRRINNADSSIDAFEEENALGYLQMLSAWERTVDRDPQMYEFIIAKLSPVISKAIRTEAVPDGLSPAEQSYAGSVQQEVAAVVDALENLGDDDPEADGRELVAVAERVDEAASVVAGHLAISSVDRVEASTLAERIEWMGDHIASLLDAVEDARSKIEPRVVSLWPHVKTLVRYLVWVSMMVKVFLHM